MNYWYGKPAVGQGSRFLSGVRGGGLFGHYKA